MVETLLSDERDSIPSQIRHEPTGIERALAKLSSPCRLVLEDAHHLAAARDATHLRCEHLLMSLAAHQTLAAGRALAAVAITQEDIHSCLGFIEGSAPPHDPNDDVLPLSPRSERILLAAEKECAKRGATEIGTLHVLAALLAERDGLAVFVLEAPAVGLERLGAAVQTAYREKWED
jgi:ATP-dependent Clp protease ATP-binding subunit ClpA